MAPILQQRRGKQQRQNHTIYVQQLFKDFITRNSGSRGTETGRPIVAANNSDYPRRQDVPLPRRKQPGIFDRAVYARFERATHGQEALIRCEPTGGLKTGLMKWIDQQRSQPDSQQRQSHVPRRPTRGDDYLNLPSNFFSGSDQMKLSFDVCDKTVGNVTSNFIPPATSTPFERMNSFGVSGVLSDPDEFQPTQGRSSIHRTSNERTAIGWEGFLQNVHKVLAPVAINNSDESILEQHRTDLKQIMRNEIQVASLEPKKDEDRCTISVNPVQRSANKMETFCRPSWKDHSFISNHNFALHMQRQKSAAGMPIQTSRINYNGLSFLEPAEIQQPKCTDTFATNETTPVIPTYRDSELSFLDETCTPTQNFIMAPLEDTMLLTASPPSPSLSAVPANNFFEERSFFFDQTRTDDSLIAKLDELLHDVDGSPINGSAKRMYNNFDFPSHVETTPMESIFNRPTRRLQHSNGVNQTWMIDKASPFYLTPDDTMGSTFSDDLF
ncbi:uncharacterized protein LOC126570836 [Anopheles aquasalis]|uniref:uncharacterized protein LOC126570836 n=1 Tax=Anopheles aquasalis TaxID=42839 RepID=UPI00215B48BA|nr:uncharacterized protein LOC126570836 [Anopheles aquasalis]